MNLYCVFGIINAANQFINFTSSGADEIFFNFVAILQD